jgi:hypothetical protein
MADFGIRGIEPYGSALTSFVTLYAYLCAYTQTLSDSDAGDYNHQLVR